MDNSTDDRPDIIAEPPSKKIKSTPPMRDPRVYFTGARKALLTKKCQFSGITFDKEFIHNKAEIAMSSFNNKSLSKKFNGPEYEIVDTLVCVYRVLPTLSHINFIARPINATDAENELFFAELEEDRNKDLICNYWSRLGPNSTETGLRGCRLCGNHPRGNVHHPPRGRFTTTFRF